ncbi:unnamed protein product [Rhizoctonia solani]|uniref:Uncharacterized protein n=1 Tax=Rhizoctonia solani TaxID=456999 RepID=A0A8H2WQ70_9AGAM|nr:unnamed protein product [Rhizoctonia solani]
MLEEWIPNQASGLNDESYKSEFRDTCIDPDWTLGDHWFEWTYVIDLDNRVLTVNEFVHFRFDNMPPLSPSDSNPGFVGYLEPELYGDGSTVPDTPAEYLASVDLWLKSRHDTTQPHSTFRTFSSKL